MPDYLKQIMKEIDIHFAESHSLDQLAGKYGVNKFHLSKEFKRYVGTTLNEYIIRTRLSHAKELLKYSELSVSQIAEQCGIPNTSHFINLFKNREDSTPHQYRLEWNQ